MTTEIETVYQSLLANVESTISTTKDGKKWGCVYLDNARPADMSTKSFRSYLAALSKEGRYRVIDGHSFGDVLLTPAWLKDDAKVSYLRGFISYESALSNLEGIGMSAGEADDWLFKDDEIKREWFNK